MNRDWDFPEAKQDDLCLTLGPFAPGKLPLKQARIRTETAFEDLEGSMAELGNGILLAVQSKRCCEEDAVFFRPLDQRGVELEGYRKRGCTIRRNGDSNSNFFTVEASGSGVVWIRNQGERSLRFQTPDGAIYRICMGCTEALTPSNVRAQVAPIQVLLDLNNNLLDLRIGAVYVKYGRAPWRQCGVDCLSGAHVDSYFCRIFSGDDCLGVLESFSNYFLEAPRLEFLDIDSYGPSRWYVRNKGDAPLTVGRQGGWHADVPADGQVYRLESLIGVGKEAGV